MIPGFWRQSIEKPIFLLLHYGSPDNRIKEVNTSKVRDRLLYIYFTTKRVGRFLPGQLQIFWPPQHCVFPASGGTAFPTA